MLAEFFSALFIILGVGLMISSAGLKLLPAPVTIVIGLLLIITAKHLGEMLVHFIEGGRKSALLEKKQAQLEKNQDSRKRRQYSQQEIGFQYFKTTFLFAGHIAASDGEICEDEQRHLDSIIARLHLNQAQIDAATGYFYQGAAKDFDRNQAIETFIEYCEFQPALCDAFLETQFSFAHANQKHRLHEYRILKTISQSLNATNKYQSLAEEFRLAALKEAEETAQARVQAQRRERDKRRYETEKARSQSQDSKLSPKAREIKLAFAILGIPHTASPAEIKRAYREQIKRHHPDNLIASGYPSELLAEATQRSSEINKAFDLLKRHYKFR